MSRKVLLMSAVLVTLALAPAASASKPIRMVNPGQDDAVIVGQCAFPVLGHIDGAEIITLFTDNAGNPVKGIVTFPGNTITFTNMITGTSVEVMATGSSQIRVASDGSVTARAMGHGGFFPNPITGAPGIWDINGQGISTIDAHGNPTSSTLHGKLVDLCPRLAA